jgi:stringent starvation protein B
MSNNSTKPYLIRSIYDWCIDSGFTPFISVKAYPGLDMPMEYVKNGEIVFNISAKAAYDLIINNDIIYFMARFNGVSRKLEIPISAVIGIFAKEVNQGIAFSIDKEEDNQEEADHKQSNIIQDCLTYKPSKPKLQIVK